MKLNSEKQVYRYSMINTFANIYYPIRDFVKGKSYYDGQFMTEYRQSSGEYENESQQLISSYLQNAKINSFEEAKNRLLDKLNQGIYCFISYYEWKKS